MNLTRFKRLWELSRKDPIVMKRLEALSDAELDLIPNANDGDGKAVFFEMGTQEDFDQLEKKDKGLEGIFGT